MLKTFGLFSFHFHDFFQFIALSRGDIQRRLLRDIFNGGREDELPILSERQTINVTLSMQLNSIVDVVSLREHSIVLAKIPLFEKFSQGRI